MKQVKETPLFVTESEMPAFPQLHPEYDYYIQVYYNDNTLAGYLAYKEELND